MAARFERVVAFRLPVSVFAALRQQARDDDRPMSSYLRRVVASAVAARSAEAQEKQS